MWCSSLYQMRGISPTVQWAQQGYWVGRERSVTYIYLSSCEGQTLPQNMLPHMETWAEAGRLMALVWWYCVMQSSPVWWPKKLESQTELPNPQQQTCSTCMGSNAAEVHGHACAVWMCVLGYVCVCVDLTMCTTQAHGIAHRVRSTLALSVQSQAHTGQVILHDFQNPRVTPLPVAPGSHKLDVSMQCCYTI